jgi:DNA helicase-2/ATP-dependent DNA helicase PcrA
MSRLLDGLNPEQARAVTTTEGPVLVLAGAGTGKTRVITVRIAHLLERGVKPESILALTFTNKAAREMRERVAQLVGREQSQRLFAGTFHSFCVRLLREHGRHADLPPGFTICDDADQLATARAVLRDLRIPEKELQPAALKARVSLMKNKLVSAEDLLARATSDQEATLARAWQRYDEQLRRARTLDFDDLLLSALVVLRKPGGPRAALERRYRYLLVDEYQDTNGPQYETVRLLAAGHRNLCVVGDDDQSIYGWRGADVTRILSFAQDFPGAAVVRLETNYRSTPQILGVANRVIQHNHGRHEKSLRAASGAGDPVTALKLDDEQAEAEYVAREIAMLQERRAARWKDFAVLFRAAAQSRAFEAALRARAIPYVLVGGMSFFDRKEVRDLVALLRIAVNPDDEPALLRVINCPPRGVGEATLDRVLAFATREGIPAARAFARADEIEGVPATVAATVADFLNQVRESAGTEGSLPRRIERLLEEVDYQTEVRRCHPDALEFEARWASVAEVLNFAENHERRQRGASLATFLEELSLSATDEDKDGDDQDQDAVRLTTIHAAKGLEFPRVFLVCLEEGLFPHLRALEEGALEEERRLMYVAITRARRHLTLTHAETRARYGKRLQVMPSRFLFEVRGTEPPPAWRAADSAAPAAPAPRGRRAAGRKRSGGTAAAG